MKGTQYSYIFSYESNFINSNASTIYTWYYVSFTNRCCSI
ncbi:hypothetical protein BCAH1134_C0009 (plasmid) [Bacillus cereus AH1134]|nr:hypothetical protein BCAH1134_C0009 [Bacillus cereus AH1134]